MRETRFKETEIGLIPEDWEVTTIGQQCSLFGRIGFRGYTKADLVDKGFGAITFSPSDIHDSVLDYSDCDYISYKKYEESPEIKVNDGDILFCKTASIGKCALVEGLKEKATINPQFVVLKSIKCDNRFLYYILIDKRFQDRVQGITGGSTIPTMSQEKLKEQKIQLPNREEQEAIAEILSDVDGLIRELDAIIAKKKAIKVGAMQELLTGRKRLEGFSGEWVEKKLGDILDFEQPSPYLVHSTKYSETGVPVLTAGKTFVLGYTDENFGVYEDVPVIIFDDFMTTSKYVSFPFKAKSSAMKILSLKDDNNDLRFIFELMQIIGFVPGDHQRYWISQYSKLVVSVPSLAEQQAIAEILSDMDAEIAGYESEKAKYEKLKVGMMQELLTGRVRVGR